MVSYYADTLQNNLSPGGLKETYPDYSDQLLYSETVPETTGEYVPAGDVLPDSLATALDNELYSHQADALAALQNDENVTVATSTSSGKTWIYTLYYALLKQENPDARALFLYPTKALSADQEKAVNDLLSEVGVDASAETYDGDTKPNRKPVIRDRKDIIISNFSGINAYLPSHVKWSEFFQNVELLVIDESHTYTGVHGMHVCWVLRRLQRVLAHYGADPQIVCSTATIGNPKEHSEALTGAEFTVVDNDGSPHGRREIAFWQPPLDDDEHADVIDELAANEARTSAGSEAARVTAHLALGGVQTLSFLRSRQGVEVAALQSKDAAGDHPSSEFASIRPYHAGLSKRKRRAVENQLKGGEVDAVFTTNALELGIDIGSVDSTVLAGYPGTRQSFWQQIGRAGRGVSDALSVYVPRNAAMDQYIVDNPEYLLADENIEDAVVDLSNNAVYARHVLCAADEIPLTDDDVRWFGPRDRLERAVSVWRDAGKMSGDLERGVQYSGPPRPQSTISMYATTDVQYDVRCTNDDIEIEPLQKERAYRDFHPGALVVHDGVEYEVTDIVENRNRPYVEVERTSTNEYTVTSHEKSVRDVVSERSIDLGDGFSIHAGTATVEIEYTEYRRVSISDGSTSRPFSIDLDPITLRTQVMWVEMPGDMQRRVVDRLDEETFIEPSGQAELAGVTDEQWTFAGGLHGAEHGMIKMSPLELRLDNSDMGGLSTPWHNERGCPVWFIHDAVEGGVGFAHSVYEHFEGVGEKTRNRVENCDCGRDVGCPSCLMSSQCGNNNEPLHTAATVEVLSSVLGRV